MATVKKIKKAQKGTVSQQSYYSSGEPAYKLSADTTGYSKGKEFFPGVIRTGKSSKYDKKANFSRRRVDDIIKNPIGSKNLSGKKGITIKKAKNGAWQRKEGKNPSGGLNQKGRDSYNRETGGHLKAPQPEGGPRKRSFCARMKGMKRANTSAKTANDPNSRINKSLRKWKC